MSLKPGDLCIVIDPKNGRKFRQIVPGDIVKIISPSKSPTVLLPAWHVDHKGDTRWAVHEACLRKIDPDDDLRKVVSWDECPWKPKKEIRV